MSVDISGASWDQCVSMVQYWFMSTETIRLVRTGQLSHSSWALGMYDATHLNWCKLSLMQHFSTDATHLNWCNYHWRNTSRLTLWTTTDATHLNWCKLSVMKHILTDVVNCQLMQHLNWRGKLSMMKSISTDVVNYHWCNTTYVDNQWCNTSLLML